MKLEHIRPEALTLWQGNTREHSEENILAIARVLTKHGFLDPIGISADNRVVFGNGRVLAALKLGLETIPCLRLPTTLSETELREIQIAHNRLAEKSSWAKELLQKELSELADYGVNLLDIGFSDADLQALGKEIDQLSAEFGAELQDFEQTPVLFGEEVDDFGEEEGDFEEEEPTETGMGADDLDEDGLNQVFKIELPPEEYSYLSKTLEGLTKKFGQNKQQTFMILVDSATTMYL